MIIVIAGPTGVGKTKLSIELAKKYNAEIINADSVQVYKKIDIASAKVTEEEKEGIPHHLFDIKEYDEDYTVYDYQIDARKVLNNLLKENKNVIIIEDIVDSGLTLNYLYNYLSKKNPKNLKICVLLDKKERRTVPIKIDYTCFEIENKFVIGYGLDYDERYRNLPYIGYIEEN